MLSMGGRLMLVNAVLSSILIYWMSSFMLPQQVIQKIDKKRREFLWRGDKPCYRIHCLVSWDKVCQPKFFTGLKIIDLKIFNQYLSTKKWCHLYSDQVTLWKDLILKLHFNGNLPSKLESCRSTYGLAM